ncbi:MAG: hypothetical protein LBM98_05305 [Oscillospiraceae bacterium]|nr:hypothetical protein [Oscillospiraceae bacterium]
MRSTARLAIRRTLQVRSNPVPGGQHTSYVPTYRRVVRQPWIASPHINGTYRKCGGGFAKTGWAKPSPVPAQCAGTVDGVTSAHGAGRADGVAPRRARGTTPPPTAAPLPRGEFTGEGGFETRPYAPPAQPTSKPIPLCGGVPPAGGRVVSPAGRNPRPNPRL